MPQVPPLDVIGRDLLVVPAWWRALLEGPILQPRLLWFALRSGRDRAWVAGEAITATILFVISAALIPITIIPAAYAALMIAGSWLFPIITAYIPHVTTSDSELTQTKLFRGTMLSVVGAQH